MVGAVDGLFARANVGEDQLRAGTAGCELLELGQEALSYPASACGGIVVSLV
jgi:hypothetical protein